ncbi:MAG TPA: TolC family protein [Candidatus Ozemobacteraceae bacterium]|nr:TolC family protein [Candidatus Ozemobacteraceae bacterium]
MQRDETSKRIELGSIPESELAAAEAEVALREEAYINAGSQIETTRISLLRMINPNSDEFWKFHLELSDEPADLDFPATSPQDLIEIALEKRPELRQAQLDLEKGKLELVRTKNGLLPRLDFFTTLGKSGYAQTFEKSADKFGLKGYDLQAGVLYELALGKREARMQVKKSELSIKRSQEAIDNLKQLVQEDVLKAFLEAKRAALQIRATEKTVAKQQEKVRVETIKFGLGKTTAFQVAQAQRDVAASQIAALKSRVGYLVALTDLYRYAGILCERRQLKIAVAN